MKSRLSAFMDGELPASELDQLLAEIAADGSAATWRYYELARSVVSDESVRLTHTEIYSADLTRRVMAQVASDASAKGAAARPRSAEVIPFPSRLRRWGVPASVAASAAAAAIFLGAFESGGPEPMAKNSRPTPETQIASAPVLKASPPSLNVAAVTASAPAPADPAVNDKLTNQPLVRSREPVENQVIPELNEFILQHNSIASSRHFQPSLSYARVVSHSAQ